MSVEIDKRPIWVLLLLKGRRPFFFFILAIVAYHIASSPTPEGLTLAGQRGLAVFFVCLVLWVTNALPLAVTSILAIALVPLLGVLPKEEAYSLFGNEAVFFILGAFILAGAVVHSGLSNRIALAIMERFGSSPKRLLVSIYLLAAVLSFFMSEHAVAAMLFPIVLEIARSLKLEPGKSSYGVLLFLSLAWGCIIGGIATFLGGARVPLAMGILGETTGIKIGFLEYSVAVFPLVLTLLIAGYFILTFIHKIDIESVDTAHEVLKVKIKEMGKVGFNEYATFLVMVLTITAWIFYGTDIGLAAVALTSVVVLFVFKLVKWNEIESYVNWGIVLMYGGAIILGTALERSGAALWVADIAIGEWIRDPWVLIALLSLATLLLTEGISNAAVIAILLPIAIGLSGKFNLSPLVLTYAICVPAGLAFNLPLATPANAIAISSKYVTTTDMVKAGVFISLTGWILFNLTAAYYWPLIGLR